MLSNIDIRTKKNEDVNFNRRNLSPKLHVGNSTQSPQLHAERAELSKSLVIHECLNVFHKMYSNGF